MKSAPMTSFRKMVAEAMAEAGESFDDVVFCSVADDVLDREFKDGDSTWRNYVEFFVWTTERVYLPIWDEVFMDVQSAPRNPPVRKDGV